MDGRLHCELDVSVEAFAAAVLPWLSGDPVDNHVMASVIAARADGEIDCEDDALWVRIMAGPRLVAAAVHTPPRGLLLPDMTEDAVRSLVDTLSSLNRRLPGVNGPRHSADRFASLWSIRNRTTATAEALVRPYQLVEVRHPEAVAGQARRGRLSDLARITDFMRGFAAETSSDPGRFAEYRATVARRLRAGAGYWLWEVAGEPVAMAMESKAVAGVVRIQLVYTPPDHRGNGYAGAMVAALAADIVSRPTIEECILYSDLADPRSHRVYLSVGFRPRPDTINYVFAPFP